MARQVGRVLDYNSFQQFTPTFATGSVDEKTGPIKRKAGSLSISIILTTLKSCGSFHILQTVRKFFGFAVHSFSMCLGVRGRIQRLQEPCDIWITIPRSCTASRELQQQSSSNMQLVNVQYPTRLRGFRATPEDIPNVI